MPSPWCVSGVAAVPIARTRARGSLAASSSLDSGVDRGEWLGAHFAALDHSQFMHDMDGKVWNFQLKTWHNVVASGGRATYVLENTGTPRRVLGSIRRFG